MIFFYVDESGTGLGDEHTPFFILAAVAIPASKWQDIDSQVTSLKRRIIPYAKPEDFEIKGRDMRRGDKLFKGQDWATRAKSIDDVAQLIAELPCQVFAVQVDKRDLPDYISSDSELYRLAFWRLLEEIEMELAHVNQPGILMVDMRSDMHTSVQDRRLIDAYREWIGARQGQTRLVEMPWFGFSAFYAGLQLADFAAYLTDYIRNEGTAIRQEKKVSVKHRQDLLTKAFARFRSKVRVVTIP